VLQPLAVLDGGGKELHLDHGNSFHYLAEVSESPEVVSKQVARVCAYIVSKSARILAA